jgi:hypothetical protein
MMCGVFSAPPAMGKAPKAVVDSDEALEIVGLPREALYDGVTTMCDELGFDRFSMKLRIVRAS